MSRVNIAIFSTGSLGDMLMILPSIHLIHEMHPNEKLIMIKDQQLSRNHFSVEDFYEGLNFFSEFIHYKVGINKFLNLKEKVKLLNKLRKRNISTLYYLAPSRKTYKQSLVDRYFFKASGIKNIVGLPNKSSELNLKERPLPKLKQEADLILERLRSSDISIPKVNSGKMSLCLTNDEKDNVKRWAEEKLNKDLKYYILSPGAMASIKQWPIEKYISVAKRIYDGNSLVPIVTGIEKDQLLADQIKEIIPEAVSSCGQLSIRESVCLMHYGKFYLGNDGGGMHLAVCAGLKCIAIFSARDFPGKWYPYGSGHKVHRLNVECEGCWLDKCTEYENRCLTEISDEMVYKSCLELIKEISAK